MMEKGNKWHVASLRNWSEKGMNQLVPSFGNGTRMKREINIREIIAVHFCLVRTFSMLRHCQDMA